MKKLLVILLTTLTIATLTACGESQKIVSKPPENVTQVIQENVTPAPETTKEPKENSPQKTNKKGMSYYNVHKNDIKFNTDYLRVLSLDDKTGLVMDIQYSTDEKPELFGYIKNSLNYQVSVYSNIKTSELYTSIVNQEGLIAAKTTETDSIKEAFADSFLGNGIMTDFTITEIQDLTNEEDYDVLTCSIVEGQGTDYNGLVYVDKETDEILKIEIKEYNLLFESIEAINIDMSIFNDCKEYSEADFLTLLIAITFDAISNPEFNFQDGNEMMLFAMNLDSYLSKNITITSNDPIDNDVLKELLDLDFESLTLKEGSQNEYILTINEFTHTAEEWSQIIKNDLNLKNKLSKDMVFHFKVALTDKEYELFYEQLSSFDESDENIDSKGSFLFYNLCSCDIYCTNITALEKLYEFLDECDIEY